MLLWQGNSTYDTEADKRRLRNIRHDNNIKQILEEWIYGILIYRACHRSFFRTHGDMKRQ